jgi:hypothetical protein
LTDHGLREIVKLAEAHQCQLFSRLAIVAGMTPGICFLLCFSEQFAHFRTAFGMVGAIDGGRCFIEADRFGCFWNENAHRRVAENLGNSAIRAGTKDCVPNLDLSGQLSDFTDCQLIAGPGADTNNHKRVAVEVDLCDRRS